MQAATRELGIGCFVIGATFAALGTASILFPADGWDGPDKQAFFAGQTLVGAVLIAVGVALLRKVWYATARDVTWSRYYRRELIAGAIVVGAITVLAAIPRDQREALMTEIHYLRDSLGIARGR
jgi:hypothetical protein